MEKKDIFKDEGFEIFGNWKKGIKKMKRLLPYLSKTDLKFESGKER